jgi:NitT/TauT family transport system ATP-binding protein
LGLRFRGGPRGIRDERVYEASELLGITEYPNKYPRHISGGTARKASIARALVLNPDILLPDEPYSGLDASSIMNLQIILKRINSLRNVAMLIVSHQTEELTQISDRIYVLTHKPSRAKLVSASPFKII